MIIQIITVLILLYFITLPTIEKFQNYHIFSYNNGFTWPNWMGPWNIPTRYPKLYYDTRGDPNLVYRRLLFGGYSPYGYVFGPYIYDAEGKLIYDSNKSYYIA